MIEHHILQKLSYGSLKSLLVHGELNLGEKFQVTGEASLRPSREKKFFKLVKSMEARRKVIC